MEGKFIDKKLPITGNWNYRIGTKIEGGTRLFSIIECYYDENGDPAGYAERNPLANWENLNDLDGTHKLIERAFDKLILDTDNWPNIYKPSKDGT